MNVEKELLKRKILTTNTVVTLKNDDAEYTVEKYENGKYLLKNGKLKYVETFDNFETIDSQSIKRICQAYDISENNSVIIVEEKTDVKNNIFGKPFASINGVELKDEMRIVLQNDVTKKMNCKTLYVKGVGTEKGIELYSRRGRPKKL